MFDTPRLGVNVENADESAGEIFHYLPPGRLSGGGDEPVGDIFGGAYDRGSSADNTQVRGLAGFQPSRRWLSCSWPPMREKKDNKYVDADGDQMADKTTQSCGCSSFWSPSSARCPAPPASTPPVRYRITGLDKLRFDDKNLFESDDANTQLLRVHGSRRHARSKGPRASTDREPVSQARRFAQEIGGGHKDDEDDNYPFLSAEITLSSAQAAKTGQVSFTAEPITVEILSAFGSATDEDATIQTLRIPLPTSCKASRPRDRREKRGDGRGADHGPFYPQDMRQPLIQYGDVVLGGGRSIAGVEGRPAHPCRARHAGNPPVSFRDDREAMENSDRWVFPSQAELLARFELTDSTKRALHSLRSGAFTEEQFSKATQDDQIQTTEETSGKLLAGFTYPAFFSPSWWFHRRENRPWCLPEP